MCLDPKMIFNRHIKRYVMVDCGKCKSCLQRKANGRAARIRYNIKENQIVLFVTLTYTNDFVPYIDTRGLSVDAINFDVPVYRQNRGRFIRVSSDYDFRFTSYRYPSVIDSIPELFVPRDAFYSRNSAKLLHLRNMPSNYVGICYYPDVINFIKRLRVTLQRKYNFNEHFTYFSCSEYGGKTQRPHFHLLFFIPSNAESIFRKSILTCWPYADGERTDKFIQIARDCAGYVASYVNGNSCLSEVLTSSFTRQKHSYSKGFGVGLHDFSLPQVLEKADRGDMSFSRRIIKDGISCIVTLPIPQYVIRRYFPYFKGFSRLNPSSLAVILQGIASEGVNFRYWYHHDFYRIDYEPEQLYRIFTAIRNSYLRFHDITGMDAFDYAYYFIKVLIIRFCCGMRNLHQEVYDIDDYSDFYDGVFYTDYKCHLHSKLNIDDKSYFGGKFAISDCVRSPRLMRHRLISSVNLADLYDKKTKQKNISHYVLSEMGVDV